MRNLNQWSCVLIFISLSCLYCQWLPFPTAALWRHVPRHMRSFCPLVYVHPQCCREENQRTVGTQQVPLPSEVSRGAMPSLFSCTWTLTSTSGSGNLYRSWSFKKKMNGILFKIRKRVNHQMKPWGHFTNILSKNSPEKTQRITVISCLCHIFFPFFENAKKLLLRMYSRDGSSKIHHGVRWAQLSFLGPL